MIGFELCFFFKILMLSFVNMKLQLKVLLNSLWKVSFSTPMRTCIIFFFQNAAVAFSALVQALDELNVVAIVRYAYDRRCNPQIGVAFPCIKDTYEVTFHLYLFLEIL